MRGWSLALLTGGLALVFAGQANAQYPPNYRAGIIEAPSRFTSPRSVLNRGPRLSPYLNLARDDRFDPGLNYFLDVLPEKERRQFQAVAEQRLNKLENPPKLEEPYVLPPRTTGHPTSFGGSSRYFNPTYGRPSQRLN